jgi:hypothetical protein
MEASGAMTYSSGPVPIVPGPQPEQPIYMQAPPNVVRKAPWWVWLIVAVAFIGGCGIGVAIGASGTSSTQNNAAANVATTPPAPAATQSVAPVAATPAPTTQTTTTKPAPPPPPPPATIDDGTWTVGTDTPAGTYKTVNFVDANCYWEIDKSGTNGSDIIANDFPGGGRPSVTLQVGEDFKSDGCGQWQKIG